MTHTEGDIVVLKLVTGEEVIGTRIKANSIHVTTLENVYLIKTEITQDLKVIIYMDPFMIYSNTKEFTFHESHIILSTVANSNSIEHYLKLNDSLSNSTDKVPYTQGSKLH